MATLRMQMRRKKHRQLIINQGRTWKTVGIVLETEGLVLKSVKIRQYISNQ
jgi:hypothetical protein